MYEDITSLNPISNPICNPTLILPQVLSEHVFKLTLSALYYPALQELTLIRPVRFISPKSLPTRPDERSCPPNAPMFWPTNVTEFK